MYKHICLMLVFSVLTGFTGLVAAIFDEFEMAIFIGYGTRAKDAVQLTFEPSSNHVRAQWGTLTAKDDYTIDDDAIKKLLGTQIESAEESSDGNQSDQGDQGNTENPLTRQEPVSVHWATLFRYVSALVERKMEIGNSGSGWRVRDEGDPILKHLGTGVFTLQRYMPVFFQQAGARFQLQKQLPGNHETVIFSDDDGMEVHIEVRRKLGQDEAVVVAVDLYDASNYGKLPGQTTEPRFTESPGPGTLVTLDFTADGPVEKVPEAASASASASVATAPLTATASLLGTSQEYPWLEAYVPPVYNPPSTVAIGSLFETTESGLHQHIKSENLGWAPLNTGVQFIAGLARSDWKKIKQECIYQADFRDDSDNGSESGNDISDAVSENDSISNSSVTASPDMRLTFKRSFLQRRLGFRSTYDDLGSDDNPDDEDFTRLPVAKFPKIDYQAQGSRSSSSYSDSSPGESQNKELQASESSSLRYSISPGHFASPPHSPGSPHTSITPVPSPSVWGDSFVAEDDGIRTSSSHNPKPVPFGHRSAK